MSKTHGQSELVLALADPQMRTAVLAKVPALSISAAGWLLLHARADDPATQLGVTAVALGTLQAFRAVGMTIGPLMPFGSRAGLLKTVAWTAVGVGAFAIAQHPALLLAAAVVWGIGVGGNWVAATTMRQELAADSVQGRVAAVDGVLTAIVTSLAALGGAILADTTGQVIHALWPGLALAVVTLIAMVRAGSPRPAATSLSPARP